MNASREDFRMADDVMLLEPRVAKIEGEVIKLNSRLAGVEVDLRDLRKSMDQKLDKLDARFERRDANLATALEKLDARFERQDANLATALEKLDARFERQDVNLATVLGKLDARLEKQDERFERRDAKLDAKIDKTDAKLESRLEALSTRSFTLWVTVISAAATIAAAVLAIIFGSPHGH